MLASRYNRSNTDIAARPLAKAVIAVMGPGVAFLVGYAGVLAKFTSNRVFDACIAVPLVIAGYCGVVAFRSKDAGLGVRRLGLLGAIVCFPYAVVMAFITIFGLG